MVVGFSGRRPSPLRAQEHPPSIKAPKNGGAKTITRPAALRLQLDEVAPGFSYLDASEIFRRIL